MNKLVNTLIDQLDKEEDALLIGLLKQKIINEFTIKEPPCLNPYTKKEFKHAVIGADRILSCFREKILDEALEQNKKYQRIDSILMKYFGCKKCPNTKIREVSYTGDVYFMYDPGDTKRCRICEERKRKLFAVLDNIKAFENNKYSHINLEDEKFTSIIECKTMVTKLTKKLRNYDASKH